MHHRGDRIASQDCLIGLACRDMVHPFDASRLAVAGDHACDSNHPWCGSPRFNRDAARQWEQCGDQRSLDFQSYISIPILDACVPNLTAREKIPYGQTPQILAAKATDIGGILSSDSLKLTRWRRTYGIHTNCVLLVHQESLDKWQERLGQKLDHPPFFGLFKQIGGRVVFVSPGYSVYDDGSMCPLRQTLNMRRSLHVAAIANRAGIPSIPTLGWNSNRPEDITFLSHWLSRQGRKVQVVAVNAQTGTANCKLAVALGQGMAEIEHQTGRALRWVVFGGRKRIETLCEFVPRSRITQVSRPKDFSPLSPIDRELVLKAGSVL